MPDETENGVPVSHSATMPPTGADSSTPSDGDQRELEVAVEREQQQEDHEQGQRQHDVAAALREAVYSLYSPPQSSR